VFCTDSREEPLIQQPVIRQPVIQQRAIAMLWILAAATSLRGAEPTFTLSFGPCPPELKQPPGTTFHKTFGVLLTTTDNPSVEGDGAQGWSISLSTDGVEIVELTTRGTAAAKVTDNPPGVRKDGFEKSELAQGGAGDCAGRAGAVSAVVLSFAEKVTLPASGTAKIGALTVRGTMPPELSGATPASLFFVDGCGGSG
jgi:hypothetical protein